ncbi:MAG: HAD family hydrolase [Xanthobacteraceae bacterium]|nr:HAD family hydrolase [Xanthobacteraceae bacterium]
MLQASRFARAENEFRERFGSELAPLRVSVLASLSSQHLIAVLKLFLYAEGFAPSFAASEFDGIALEGLDPEAQVWRADPEALVVLPSVEDIKVWPKLFASDDEIARWVEDHAQLYRTIWQQAAARMPDCRIYHGLFALPLERPLGNLENSAAYSRTNCLRRLNQYLTRHAPANVTPVDLDYLASLAGRMQWTDEPAYFGSKQPLSLREMPLACAYLARLIASGRGRVRKCLVLDLDNTLWGGVIGDDGPGGIRIDPSDPVGEAYLAFQRYILALKDRGVLIAACSKNDPKIARSAFEENEHMLLKVADFAAFEANWEDKVSNIRRIADVLNIGLDSLVFFDDNPAERAIVEQYAPQVLVIDAPEDPSLFVRALDLSFAFEWPNLTAEDLARTDSFVKENQREELRKQFADYDTYLKSLAMKATIEPTQGVALSRVAQLFNKTNQFNLRTIRYSEQELETLIASRDHLVLHVSFADKFTNYGIMAAAVLRFAGGTAFIENWVMSCRAFKRGLEEATLNAIMAFARERGANFVAGEYIPTPKNGYVADLFNKSGFEEVPSNPQWSTAGNALFRLPANAPERRHFIAVG